MIFSGHPSGVLWKLSNRCLDPLGPGKHEGEWNVGTHEASTEEIWVVGLGRYPLSLVMKLAALFMDIPSLKSNVAIKGCYLLSNNNASPPRFGIVPILEC